MPPMPIVMMFVIVRRRQFQFFVRLCGHRVRMVTAVITKLQHVGIVTIIILLHDTNVENNKRFVHLSHIAIEYMSRQ